MIVFEPGPRGRQAVPIGQQQNAIRALLYDLVDESSFSYMLQIAYNNQLHMSTRFAPLDPFGFVKDVHCVAIDADNVLRVCGGVHTDTGHFSGVLGTYVSDTFVRFSVDACCGELIAGRVYHFLVCGLDAF